MNVPVRPTPALMTEGKKTGKRKQTNKEENKQRINEQCLLFLNIHICLELYFEPFKVNLINDDT